MASVMAPGNPPINAAITDFFWAWRLDPKQSLAANLAAAARFRQHYYGDVLTGAVMRAELAAQLPPDAPLPVTVHDAVPAGTIYFTPPTREH